MSFIPGRIRGQVNVAKPRETWIDKQTGESPEAWRGFALQIDLAFFVSDTELMTFIGFQSVTVEIHEDSAKIRPAVATVQATNFNIALSVEDWQAGSAFHCKASFSESDMALDLGGANDSKTFWVFVHGIDADGNRKPLGGTTLKVYESGTSTIAPGPNQGANLIPGGAVYDGSGNYVVATTANKKYEWTDGGANDTSIVNGSDTLTTSQTFTAAGASVTLVGTPSAAVTSLLRYPLYPTLDEMMAMLVNVMRSVGLPGQYLTFISENGLKKRTIGVDNDGGRIDQLEDI